VGYLHAIQHSRVFHLETWISPFEAYFGYQPFALYELPLTLHPLGTPNQYHEQAYVLSFYQT